MFSSWHRKFPYPLQQQITISNFRNLSIIEVTHSPLIDFVKYVRNTPAECCFFGEYVVRSNRHFVHVARNILVLTTPSAFRCLT